MYYLVAPNELVVVGLLPGHPALRAGPPRAVRYADQLATAQVSGKRKRNAPALGAGAVLAIVEARGGGGAFEVRAGLPGKLLEVNQRVAADPRLLSERPEADGYLAVLQPPAKELRALRQRTEVF